MAVGNYWIYADTVWFNDTPYGRIDTVKVLGRITDNLGEWWILSRWFFNLGDRIMVRGDSILTYQCCFEGPDSTWPYAEVEYLPPLDTPFVHSMVLEGDITFRRTVFRLDSAVTTPAGEFHGLYGYEGSLWFQKPQVEFLMPGIGFVYHYQPTDAMYPYPDPPNTYSRRAWLIGYQVASPDP